MPEPRIHYQRARIHAECGLPRPPVPDSELTSNLLSVTCGACHRTLRYRADAAGAARMARHELPGQAVLNPEFLSGGVL